MELAQNLALQYIGALCYIACEILSRVPQIMPKFSYKKKRSFKKKRRPAQKTANAKDPQLNHIEDLWWLEHVRSPLNVQEVNDWMFGQMFNARTIRTTNIRNMTCLFKRVFWYNTKTSELNSFFLVHH